MPDKRIEGMIASIAIGIEVSLCFFCLLEFLFTFEWYWLGVAGLAFIFARYICKHEK